jgi:hypothetical protein
LIQPPASSRAANFNSVIAADLCVLQVKEHEPFYLVSWFDQRTPQYSGFLLNLDSPAGMLIL